jgi:hypothetical protein
MIDLIEQSNLYRLIAIAVTLFSFWKIAQMFFGSATPDAGFLPFTPELSRVVIATVMAAPDLIVLPPIQTPKTVL